MKITRLTYSLAVLLTLVLFLNSCDNKPKNDWEKENLKGKVKSYVMLQYDVLFDSLKTSETFRIEKEYDKKGNLLKESTTNPQSEISNRVEYTYDEKNYRKKAKGYVKDTLKVTVDFEYDENGYLVKEQFLNVEGKLMGKTLYENDKKGNKTEEKRYDQHGKISYRITFLYDNNENKIEESYYLKDTILISKSIIEYDTFDNPIIIISTNIMDNNSESKINYKYKYDSEGNWIKMTTYRNDELKPLSVVERKIEYYK